MDSVTITLDGAKVSARRGLPVVAALVGAGVVALARSPKFHRPRGPSCMRGACDGCLMRVDGVPNVMTCMVPAEDGMRVESQNTLGSRQVDLLRVTDWFFPQGLNHHELFAGVPGVQSVMQIFARRVAGLGRMPKEALPARPALRRATGVVVVGAGPAGMAVAAALAGRVEVEVIEEGLVAGGGVRALAGEARVPWEPIVRAFDAAVACGEVRLRTATVAGAVYGRDLLVVGPEGAEVLEPRALVLATGAHDGVLAFEGNDVPGVMSARAAGLLLACGAPPGRKPIVVATAGAGPFGDAFAAVTGAVLLRGTPVRARGGQRVKEVTVRDANGAESTHACDALVIDATPSPAYELAAQAGGLLRHEPRGFVVETDACGALCPAAAALASEASGPAAPRAAALEPWVWAVGEIAGAPFDPAAIARAASLAAASVLSPVPR